MKLKSNEVEEDLWIQFWISQLSNSNQVLSFCLLLSVVVVDDRGKTFINRSYDLIWLFFLRSYFTFCSRRRSNSNVSSEQREMAAAAFESWRAAAAAAEAKK